MSNGDIRGWCPIEETWGVFPPDLAWLAEPCRALAHQFGFSIGSVQAMAQSVKVYGPAAAAEGEAIYREHLDAIHDAERLRGGRAKLTIAELVDIARRSRIALARIIRCDCNPERRAKLEAKLAEMDELARENHALAQQAMLEQED
jgi:hypothetical protein